MEKPNGRRKPGVIQWMRKRISLARLCQPLEPVATVEVSARQTGKLCQAAMLAFRHTTLWASRISRLPNMVIGL